MQPQHYCDNFTSRFRELRRQVKQLPAGAARKDAIKILRVLYKVLGEPHLKPFGKVNETRPHIVGALNTIEKILHKEAHDA